MRSFAMTLLFVVSIFSASAQDSSSIFSTLSNAMKTFKPDTSEVPRDKITNKIIELRSLRGGFNINEAIDYKIHEEMQKDPASKDQLNKLGESFRTGLGKKWLDNAVTWIYRETFTYRELKQLVKFYKTDAGKKMAKDFPLIMLKTLAAGEMIQQVLVKPK